MKPGIQGPPEPDDEKIRRAVEWLSGPGRDPKELVAYARLMAMYGCSPRSMVRLIDSGVDLEAIEDGLMLAWQSPHGNQMEAIGIQASFRGAGWPGAREPVASPDGKVYASACDLVEELVAAVGGDHAMAAILEFIHQRCGGNGWELCRRYLEDTETTTDQVMDAYNKRHLVQRGPDEIAVNHALGQLAAVGLEGGALRPFAELMTRYQCDAKTMEQLIADCVPLEAIEAGLQFARRCPRGNQLDITELLETFGEAGRQSAMGALDGAAGEARLAVDEFIIDLLRRIVGPEPALVVLAFIRQRCDGQGWDLHRMYCDDEAHTVAEINQFGRL